jgi:hypothetical protein
MTFPNRTNIDQWLFDYFEGNLSSEQEALLEEFLLEHPEYDADLEAMGESRASSGVDFFPGAEALKREPVWRGIYTQWAAAIALLIGITGSILWLNFLVQPTYEYIPLAPHYFGQMTAFLGDEPALDKEGNTKNETDLSSGFGRSTSHSVTPGATSSINSTSRNWGGQSNKNSMIAENGIADGAQPHNSTDSSTTTQDEHFNSSLSFSGEKNLDSINPSYGENQHELQSDELTLEVDGDMDTLSGLKSEGSALVSTDGKQKPQTSNGVARSVKNFVNSRLGLVNLRDPQFMVPGAVANDLNFAHAGSLLATRVYHSTYAQWPGREGQSFNFVTGVDGYAHALRGGLGVQVNYSNYQAGLFQNYEGSITYSPKFKIAKNLVLEPAVRFKMGAKELNANRVVPGQQIEWERGNLRTLYPEGGVPQGERLFYRDFGAALLLNSKWGFLGVNVDNIGRHYNNIYSEDLQNPERSNVFLTIHAGTDYESYNKRMSLSMYALYQNYGQLNKAWAGVNFRYRFMTVGGAVSTGLEPVGSLGITFDHFRLAYVTDYSMNQISGQRMLSHQISLRIVTKPSKYGRKLLN